jgi:putative ABC transport system permease protein
LRKGLVVFQFAIAVLLIASTLIVGKQIAFMRNRDIGADLDRTLVLEIPRLSDSEARVTAVRSVLSGMAAIQDAAFSTSVPGRTYSNSINGIRLQAAPVEEGKSFSIIDVDEHFFRLFDIPILSGRSFAEGFASDRDAVVLNEEASALLGFEDPDKALLQNIVIFGDVFRIIGVARNHHHLSLREKIEPVIYMPLPMSLFNRGYYLSLKVAGPSLGAAVSALAGKWKEIAPGQPFEYFFLDDAFNRQYDADRLFGRVFGLASLLAVSISCLGLFGLAVFSAERRKREIGIRRVFGASIPSIAGKLCGEFLRWVLLAGLIAWPVAWYVMHRWLERFPYRTAIGPGPLIAALVLALATALATVSYKAVRAALANPVDSIRYE